MRWMRAREQQPVELEHPSLKHFTTSNGMPWYGCQVSSSPTLSPCTGMCLLTLSATLIVWTACPCTSRS